jgi:uncharacterized protein
MKGAADTYSGRGLIADPIHQYILYTREGEGGEATEQDVIDTPWVQRLRRIPQLQSARWVYPSAEHSRFQHSLGAMHLAARLAQQLYPSLKAIFGRQAPSAALFEELLRMAGLLHDVGHGPFGHFFDDNFLVDYDLTHELVGQRIIREELGDVLRALRRSPTAGFASDERIDPEWICYLMGKTYTQPLESHPKWLPFLKPLLSGVFTADNMDYVLRDAYMCGVAVGPIDVERIIYYSFFSEKGLTLNRAGLGAFTMFLNARFYMYTNVYYHRTTRGIDLHLKDIFHETMRIAFPYDLRKDLHPYLHLTEWTLLEEVGRWHDADDADKKRLGAEWQHVLNRKLKWRMSGEEILDQFEARKGQGFLDAKTVEERVRRFLPAALKNFDFRIDMALQDPRPLNPLKMGDRQIYVYDSATKRVSEEPLTEILKYLPGKVAQCRIFAIDHTHDAELTTALRRALNEEPSAIVTNV